MMTMFARTLLLALATAAVSAVSSVSALGANTETPGIYSRIFLGDQDGVLCAASQNIGLVLTAVPKKRHLSLIDTSTAPSGYCLPFNTCVLDTQNEYAKVAQVNATHINVSTFSNNEDCESDSNGEGTYDQPLDTCTSGPFGYEYATVYDDPPEDCLSVPEIITILQELQI